MPIRPVHLIVGSAVLAVSCSREAPAPQEAAPKPQPVRITQFYPAEAVVRPGSNVTICYGVENAVSVAVTPPVDELKPAFNRCFSAPVPRQTEFTLTARGAQGDEVSASFTVQVSRDAGGAPARESAPAGPQIAFFTAEPAQIQPGAPPVKLCYQASNAEAVTVQPKVADLGGAMMGCFYAPTEKTTTYTLRARGGGRETSKTVTVTVR